MLAIIAGQMTRPEYTALASNRRLESRAPSACNRLSAAPPSTPPPSNVSVNESRLARMSRRDTAIAPMSRSSG